MAKGYTKTTVNIDSEVYRLAKARADSLKITFGELVEIALVHDLQKRHAIVRTEEGGAFFAELKNETPRKVAEDGSAYGSNPIPISSGKTKKR